MEFNVSRRDWQTAHEFVRETLRRAILRGDLAGGSRLIQTDLAAQLQVSTTPLREALRDLATEGLITLDRHRGGVVRELDRDDIEEIRLIRGQLEPLSVASPSRGVTDQQLREVDALCDQMDRARDAELALSVIKRVMSPCRWRSSTPGARVN